MKIMCMCVCVFARESTLYASVMKSRFALRHMRTQSEMPEVAQKVRFWTGSRISCQPVGVCVFVLISARHD